MEEEVQERQQVTVGKPLVSKLNLHEPQTPQSASSLSSHNSYSTKEWSSFAETFTSVNLDTNTTSDRKSSMASSLVPTRSVNIPEETDTPDFYNAPQPLVASLP